MSHEIAIIGMAGRFPGASDVEAFWNNLRSGIESVRDLTDEELASGGWRPEVYTDPSFVRRAGVVEGESLFDAAFFDIPPGEAELLCPQHRLILECGWEALESAGCDPSRYDGRIGVFIGATLSSYLVVNLASHAELLDRMTMADVMIAVDKDYIPTRLSYKLNLRGPSVSVNAASSTSLVAVHLAIQSLLSGECEMALAGAVSINTRPGLIVRPGSIYSPDGRCRTFDVRANGIVGGNAVGLVALKPLEQAEADGDDVLAVLVGSAVNNDGGRKASFLVPGVAGQSEVIGEALAMAGVDASAVSYVEAHGMGTELGDALEVAALTTVFGQTPRESPCGLGSVKPNIGYASGAAGIASLIKLTLALKHLTIPPTINFETPNSRLNLDSGPFQVIDRLTSWDGPSPRRAGITAFGVGGTNAHLVLEEGPGRPVVPARSHELILVSARTPSALRHTCRRLAAHLAGHPKLALRDVAFSLHRRHAFPLRRAIVASSVDRAIHELESIASSEEPPPVARGRPPAVVLVLSEAPSGRELSAAAMANAMLSLGLDAVEIMGLGDAHALAQAMSGSRPSSPAWRAPIRNEDLPVVFVGMNAGVEAVRQMPFFRPSDLIITPETGVSALQAQLDVFGRLWMLGCRLDARIFEPASARQVQLPTYPFERSRYWIPPASVASTDPIGST